MATYLTSLHRDRRVRWSPNAINTPVEMVLGFLVGCLTSLTNFRAMANFLVQKLGQFEADQQNTRRSLVLFISARST